MIKDLRNLIRLIAAETYRISKADTYEYASLRVKAMVIRDQKGDEITDADWKDIEQILIDSWRALHRAVGHAPVLDGSLLRKSR